MALRKTFQIGRYHVLNIAAINDTWRDQAVFNQFLKPSSGERVELVVIGCHATCPANHASRSARRHLGGLLTAGSTGHLPLVSHS
jgi:hypothetical protein